MLLLLNHFCLIGLASLLTHYSVNIVNNTDNVAILGGDAVVQIEKLRCPHCLEEVLYLESPKLLPCGHVICISCLEFTAAWQKTEEDDSVKITCSVCWYVITTSIGLFLFWLGGNTKSGQYIGLCERQ